ncbi:MAG TPA: hypothetical protein DDY14_16010 [Chromatiaceae bacterium]|jgi:general secretion pathway protein B|nr:MAG: hypothetical protein N838_03130 [Thiohalocapsa sp. PB-PSB1]QQO52586.1 MAG: GspB domain-containing protein [Thiohalocapsa sp. PB-PSB1]HBG96787.1 hypothetical protein [Chromatiaceae bacterium]HCS90252.1 hypothetical protein [Chromatiaceae bacterium]
MSYILEALKKSQQERELGSVPRIQAVSFDETPPHPTSQLWLYAALLLALCAVAIAVYAVLRGTQQVPPATQLALPAESPSQAAASSPEPIPAYPQASTATSASSTADAQEIEPISNQQGAAVSAGSKLESTDDSSLANFDRAAPLAAPESLSVQPEILIVPAPPKPGQELPRGAAELRRAALGTGSSVSVDIPTIATDIPTPTTESAEPASPPRDTAPVPPDLIADIEAFKKTVAATAPKPQPSPLPTAAAAVAQSLATPEPQDRTAVPPEPSLTLRSKLPDFHMAVHIYDQNPARRFVYINGQKLTEKQQSKEGLRLEKVLAEGAILSWQGEEFFQAR